MTGIAAVSGQISSAASATALAPNALAAGAAGGANSTGDVGKAGSSSAAGMADAAGSPISAGSSTSVQTSSLISSAQPNATIENIAALMLSLLLSKSDESKDKDDPWKVLAGMAMLGAMASQQGQGVTMSQSTSVVSEAYSTGGTAAAATGGSVNISAG